MELSGADWIVAVHNVNLDVEFRSSGGKWNQVRLEGIKRAMGFQNLWFECKVLPWRGGAEWSRVTLGRYTTCSLHGNPVWCLQVEVRDPWVVRGNDVHVRSLREGGAKWSRLVV